jgi:glycosyltransferase involved in cell wall biosynthesis
MNSIILHTISSLWKNSGVTDAAINAAIGIQKADSSAIIFTWQGDNYCENLPQNIEIILLNRKNNFLSNILEFRKHLTTKIKTIKDQGKTVIIHDHGLWQESNIAAALAAYETGCKLIISSHGMLEPWALSHHKLKKSIAWFAYQKNILKSVKYIHVTAQSEQDSVQKLLPSANLAKIKLGTSITSKKSQHNKNIALFLSRIHKKKGLDLLIDAWKVSSPQGWQLKIAGPDEENYVATIKQRIKTLNLDGSIQILDPVYDEEKINLYTESSLFILPSYSENFGLVIVEAMMAGLPVITTNKTPWLDLDERGVGWTISPNIEELSKAITAATILTPDQRKAMGMTARAWMIREYSWEKYQQEMNSFYLSLCK